MASGERRLMLVEMATVSVGVVGIPVIIEGGLGLATWNRHTGQE